MNTIRHTPYAICHKPYAIGILLLLLITTTTPAQATIQFLADASATHDPGVSTTFVNEFWSSGSANSVTTGLFGTKAAYHFSTQNQLKKSSVMDNAGRRTSFSFQWNSVADQTVWELREPGGNTLGFKLYMDASAFLIVVGGGTAASALTSGQTYRITVAYTIASRTVNEIRVFLDDDTTPIISSSNIDLGVNFTNYPDLEIGPANCGSCNSNNSNFGWVYVDDDTSLTNIPGLRVTSKQPATNNTGNFSSSFGVAAPANRYTNVDDRPRDLTTGWINTSSTANGENYTLQSASTGDIDMSGKTIRARMAWAYAFRLGSSGVMGAGNTGTCSGTSNNSTSCATGAFTVYPGQTVICGLASQNGVAGESIADSLSNTWTALAGPTTSTVKLNIWYSVIGAGTKAGSTTVTFSYNSANIKRAGACAAFDGLDSSTPLDLNPANGTDGTSQYDGPATGTLTQANETILGVFAFAGPSDDTYACANPTGTLAASSGTNTGGAASNASIRICYADVSATTSVQPAATDTTANRASVQSTSSWKLRGNAAPSVGSPKITDNGSDTALTLTTSAALYTVTTESASYPSNAAGIGMVGSGSSASTIFLEGGTIVVYYQNSGARTRRTPYVNVQ